MAKNGINRKLNKDRKYMGVYVDNDTYATLARKAYQEGDSLSHLVRKVLNDYADSPIGGV